MRIFIYHDYVHASGPLYGALAKRYGHENVRYVNADEVADGVLAAKPAAFVRPGGASRYASFKLRGDGFAAIKRYVETGGVYFGLCGGAYDACARTRWAEGTRYEILVDNELAFFAADAIGPIREFADARSRDGSAARLVDLDVGGRLTPCLYWGGGRFVPHEGADYTTHATYRALNDHPLAVVGGVFGKGRWLLTSAHIEYDHAALQLSTFDVADNKYSDIAGLGDTGRVSLDLFNQMMAEYVG